MADNLLTTAEAAAKLKVSAQRIRKLASDGRIPGAQRIGRDWIFPADLRVLPGKTKTGPKGVANVSAT